MNMLVVTHHLPQHSNNFVVPDFIESENIEHSDSNNFKSVIPKALPDRTGREAYWDIGSYLSCLRRGCPFKILSNLLIYKVFRQNY
jgi:hypothetical protein